ncbi:response regulator [Dactylosporangium sp. NPDC049525]|uniref:response regulator transcription factor n=1 Tax=Dactylosporangium sp. NPDC049525 TaxID=3154730 RepID=UPI00343F3A1A
MSIAVAGSIASEAQTARILVADDDPDLRGMMAYKLVKAGFEVIETDNGLAAVDAAVACLPNLVILDIMMPGQDGLSACEQLQNDPETAQIPVMLLSAPSQPDVVRSGVMAGAVHHMVKPFSPDALLRSVRSLLRVHPTPVDPNTGRDHGRSYRW